MAAAADALVAETAPGELYCVVVENVAVFAFGGELDGTIIFCFFVFIIEEINNNQVVVQKLLLHLLPKYFD